MCRPSCCRQPSHDGVGVAAVAVFIVAAVAYAKIGPELARIWHIAVEALTIFTLAAAAAAVAIVVVWAIARIIRGRREHRQALLYRTKPVGWRYTVHADGEPGCLACGDTGTVLLAIGTGSYRGSCCPVCKPQKVG